jgi:hypothetical protein
MGWMSFLFVALQLSGCAAESQRRSEDAQVQRQVSADIARICALPQTDRQSEIDRVKQQYGMTIVCPARLPSVPLEINRLGKPPKG